MVITNQKVKNMIDQKEGFLLEEIKLVALSKRATVQHSTFLNLLMVE